MNFNALQAALSQQPLDQPDPSPGNTTVGAGKISANTDGVFVLRATQTVTQEERTLPDPVKEGIELILVLYSTSGANLRVTASTAFDTSAHTHALFTAANQVVMFKSIPVSGTPIPKFRWALFSNDGTSLS